MAGSDRPQGKARATRRGGRKGSPPGGRNFKLGARGDRDTPIAHAEGGREVQQEASEPHHDELARASVRRKHANG
jgi:hypothetical protein